MTTAIENTYSFIAKLKSKGQQRNNDGWTMTLDWRLPGSKFDLVLYGQDWDYVAGINVGDLLGVAISKGNLKQDKDGRYASDFFWDPTFDLPGEDLENNDAPAEALDEMFGGKPLPDAAQAPQRGLQEPPNPAAVGACANHAMSFIESGILPVPEGRDPLSFLRELRDRIYRDVNQVPIAPPHFCYTHESTRMQSQRTGVWGHMVDDVPCLEDQAQEAEDQVEI